MNYYDLKVGFSCNNNCIHCVVADKKSTKDLTTLEVKSIINSIPQDYIVGFTGGEATCRPDILELMNYAKISGHLVSLQTNGTIFSDYQFAQQASKYLDGVLIAIHSHDPDIHNLIVRKKDMHNLTIKGFENIVKLNIPCTTQTVISNANFNTVLETYHFIQKIKPNIRMNLTFPHPNGNALKYAKKVIPKFSALKTPIMQILEIYSQLINTEAIPICYLYPYQNKIYNFDNDLINNNQKMGFDPANKNCAYFDSTGKTNNYAVPLLFDKRKGPECSKCLFDNKCVGIWKEYLDIYGEDYSEFIPIV